MYFINDTIISKEKFPDFEDRILDYFKIEQDHIVIVWKRTKMDAQENYVPCADFIEAGQVWNDPEFLEKF